MNLLYLLLDVAAIFFPVALSFDSRVQYVRNWKTVLFSTLIIAIPYLIFDQIFTQNHYWGFNDSYLTGVKLGHLPIEEVLFFFVVPFACVFIYECCKYYFTKLNLGYFNIAFYVIYTSYILYVFLLNPSGFYTLFVFVTGVVSIVVLSLMKLKYLPIAMLFSLIPFFIFNGILTGYATESPVVWYDNINNSGVRLLTIPVEDIIYGFGLIIFVSALHEKMKTFVK